jgi:hypothetical protein
MALNGHASTPWELDGKRRQHDLRLLRKGWHCATTIGSFRQLHQLNYTRVTLVRVVNDQFGYFLCLLTPISCVKSEYISYI